MELSFETVGAEVGGLSGQALRGALESALRNGADTDRQLRVLPSREKKRESTGRGVRLGQTEAAVLWGGWDGASSPAAQSS